MLQSSAFNLYFPQGCNLSHIQALADYCVTHATFLNTSKVTQKYNDIFNLIHRI